MVEEIPVFPTLYRAALQPVNNRVHNVANFELPGTEMYRYEIAVTQDEPFVAGQAE